MGAPINCFAVALAVYIAAGVAAGRVHAQAVVACAKEGQVCNIPYATTVIYGIPGASRAMAVRAAGPVACNNNTFGDPAPNQVKSCSYVAMIAVPAATAPLAAQPRPPPNPGRFLVNQLSNRCLDVTGGPGFANGSQLQIANCEFGGRSPRGGATDQRWEVVNGGFIRNTLSGKCLDVSGAPGFANGSKLQLWDCEYSGRGRNGAATDQLWEITRDGYIRNLVSGKCVDVKGMSATSGGTDVQLWDCNYNARTDMRWRWQ